MASALSTVKDVIHGWSSFTGLGDNSQFGLARQFYKNVTGADFVDSNVFASPDVIVTGHSLGGALAGFVASRTGVDSDVFDPIPFGVVAWEYRSTTTKATLSH